MTCVDERVRHSQALELGANGNEVGFASASHVRTRRIATDLVVLLPHRALGVVAADRQDVRVVRGVGQTGSADAALVAGVAGRRDHDDACVPRPFCGEGERIHQGRLRRVGSVREIEDPDVHAIVVLVVDDPVDRGDHLGDIDASIGGSDLETDDASVRSDSSVHPGGCIRVRLLQVRVFAGDQAGDECAMTIGVEVGQVWSLRFERQVGTVDNLVGSGETFDGCDPRVDDRHVDAGPGDSLIPECGGADVLGHRLHRVSVESRAVAGRPHV